MSLLDGVLGGVVNKVLGGAEGESGSLMQVATNLLQEQGGLSGLVEKFNQGGLAQQAASWVSKGENLPISAEQIQQVLGNDTVTSLAAKVGISPDQINAGLAQVLPGLIDRLTPDGQIPDDQNSLLGQALGMLKA